MKEGSFPPERILFGVAQSGSDHRGWQNNAPFGAVNSLIDAGIAESFRSLKSGKAAYEIRREMKAPGIQG